MEAIAYNNQAIRLNNMLQTGMTYDFNLVGFNPMEIPNGHFWYLAMDFVVTLHVRTEVVMSVQRITLTICPPCLPRFEVIFSLRDKSITGASSLNFLLHITPYNSMSHF